MVVGWGEEVEAGQMLVTGAVSRLSCVNISYYIFFLQLRICSPSWSTCRKHVSFDGHRKCLAFPCIRGVYQGRFFKRGGTRHVSLFLTVMQLYTYTLLKPCNLSLQCRCHICMQSSCRFSCSKWIARSTKILGLIRIPKLTSHQRLCSGNADYVHRLL